MTLHLVRSILEWIITSELLAIIWISLLPQKKPENFFNYMKKRYIPDTSRAAFESLDVSKIQKVKNDIVAALNVLGRASSDELKTYLKIYDKDTVAKRCSDLKNDMRIYASDFKVLSNKGKYARQWMLTEKTLQKTTSKSTNPNPTTVSTEKQIAMNFTN